MALRCDLIIRDATIVDGSGRPGFRGDVGVQGERIAAVGDLGAASGAREVLAGGRVLAPGFIDAHTHDDQIVLQGAECMCCKLSQGITCVVVGNCGISLSPMRLASRPPAPLDQVCAPEWWKFGSFGEYADHLRREPPAVNALALIGHMSLRVGVMEGDTQRAATDGEAERMRALLAESLAEGAAGFSTGLFYPPSKHAPTEEVIAIAEALRAQRGLYVTHMRDEANGVLDSIAETLRIGEAVGAPVVISHHKCAQPENHGRSRETLPMIEQAAVRQAVAFDVYPYTAASTSLAARDPRPDIPVQVTNSLPHPEMAGRMLADIAAEWGASLMEARDRLLPASGIFHNMSEEDVRRIMAHPLSMIGSDGGPLAKKPHPRLWGTFPRVLGHYVREIGLMDLETAIHKMTGRTAMIFGIADRGTIAPGAFADLVLLDAATVKDRSTWEDPIQPADGILETWVNGQSAYVHGAGVTGARAGRLLRRAA
ncbi:N-acyl-D-amino-acid deacylase family protein [Neoroseomonas oryzicola]|uniref:D-aminoacylase n=1 Tax=Neoroseomonas oryzicola TaxID=535904 RepID=A0A9X9WC35_9PROT|nr:D-aminoacylase [Neoroseomonas oryzicola]MBR0657895.1 D-aminoacylase [Neoroseomonas oryzicola]NKE18787.1 D-aminoacylase [Neoroseomonas oryzicola]